MIILKRGLVAIFILVMAIVGTAVRMHLRMAGFRDGGDMSGWTISADPHATSFAAHSGAYSGELHNHNQFIEQSVDLTGVDHIEWYSQWLSTNTGGLDVTVDGTPIFSEPLDATFTHRIADVDYTGEHTVRFTFTGTNAMLIDDIATTEKSAVIVIGGSIPEPVVPVKSLSISADVTALTFPSLTVGEHVIGNQGWLTVTSENTGWQAKVSASPKASGKMADGVKELANPLLQKDAGNVWESVPEWSWNGDSTQPIHTLPLSFKQGVLPEDEPGEYSITLTYTVTAV